MTVESLWTGLFVFQTDDEPDADRGPRKNLIAPPRGLPDDVSDETVAALLTGGSGVPSWLTLAELLAFDWDHPVARAGWVSPAQYRAHRRRGDLPEYGEWYGNEQHEEMGEPGERILRWTEPYSRTVAAEFVEFLHRELVPLGVPDDVRIVFASPQATDWCPRGQRGLHRFLKWAAYLRRR